MQQLSQMVLDMQARMTDMSSNLRLDFQEDASKMLVTLLNSARQPASARGAETQTIHVQDLSFAHDSVPVDEMMNKISQVADDLESKSNTLDDLVGRVSRHDGQIHLLMEAAWNHAPTPHSAPPVSDSSLRDYLDEKIRALREELMEGMDIKMADLKNSCDYKILSVREQCEGQETNYLSLAELMDSKETDLRKEIQDLRIKLIGPDMDVTQVTDPLLARVEKLEVCLNSSVKTVAAECLSVEEKLKVERTEAIKDLRETMEDKLASIEDRLGTLLIGTSSISVSSGQPEHQDAQQKEVNSVKDSVQKLQDRFDTLEQLCSQDHKANFTVVENIQQDLHSCRAAVDAVEARLKTQIDSLGAIKGHRPDYSIEDTHGKLNHVEGRVDRLDSLLTDLVRQHSLRLQSLNSTRGQVGTGVEEEAADLLELYRAEHRELRNRLDELSQEVRAKADRCKGQTEDIEREISDMDGRVLKVEGLCGKLEPIADSIHRIRDGLNKHVTGLWTCVNRLNGTVRAHGQDIDGLKGTCQNIQNLLSSAGRDPQVPSHKTPGKTGKL